MGGWEGGKAEEGTAGSAGVALRLSAEDDAWLAESDPSSGSAAAEFFRRNRHKLEHRGRESEQRGRGPRPSHGSSGMEDLNLQLLFLKIRAFTQSAVLSCCTAEKWKTQPVLYSNMLL